MSTVTRKTDVSAEVEAETQQIGRSLLDRLADCQPSIFERRWWNDRVLAWAMSDESVKLQMIRFADVLPRLRTHQSVLRHLAEYYEEACRKTPKATRLVPAYQQLNSVLGRAVALNARLNTRRIADRFVAGSSFAEVLQTVERLRDRGFAFALDVASAPPVCEDDADARAQAYIDLMSKLEPAVNSWPEDERLDCDHNGAIPRINVSIRLSELTSFFRSIDITETAAAIKSRLRRILIKARECAAFVQVDTDTIVNQPLTIQIFKQVLCEDDLQDFADVGITLQAYYSQTEHDLNELLDWTRQRGTSIAIRLVKGAHWNLENSVARANGWPLTVFQSKCQTDENFEQLTRFLMENHEWLRPQLSSHNLRTVSNGIAWARKLSVPIGAFEIQMRYGGGAEQALLLSEMGHRIRFQATFGDQIIGIAALARRLLENPTDDSFLRQQFHDSDFEQLMRNPSEVRSMTALVPDNSVTEDKDTEDSQPEFENESLTDFSKSDNVEAMQTALEDVIGSLDREYPLVIDGRAVETKSKILSYNPSHRSQLVGSVSSATANHVTNAIESARNAYLGWSRLEVEYRAEFMELIATEMQQRRFELAAWEIVECGKPWEEADHDVVLSIDYCNYYAQQMRRLAKSRRCVAPGEENVFFYRPRGVAAIISPWNSPLAALTGMTVAALVAGNTVIIKPAEQSSVIAAKFVELTENAGIPSGVVNFLPGVGDEVGPELVGSPDVNMIAFTGSRDVGLTINRNAAATDQRQVTVKHVVVEIGGNNAIIVDDDADLEEAVLGVVQSAFNYAGQSRPTCSRAIILEDIYDSFVERLVMATESLQIGPAELPGSSIGPVIDEDSLERINELVELARQEESLVLTSDDRSTSNDGYFIAPQVLTEVEVDSRLAREEILGPILVVFKAVDFDDAIRIANSTEYAVTAGVFSRSPVHLEQAVREINVEKLCLNRGITGAFARTQTPDSMGGSGNRAKLGGSDYLLQFLAPVSVTENTNRRGFSPRVDSPTDL